jgi:hypothetical protein
MIVSFYDMAKKYGLGYRGLSISGCIPISNITRKDFKGGVWKESSRCLSKGEGVSNFIDDLPPSIIVFSARLQFFLSGERFDNKEGGQQGHGGVKAFSKLDGFSPEEIIKNKLQQWVDKGHTLIAVYPIPEIGWHLPKMIKSKLKGSNMMEWAAILEAQPVTTDYSVYLERTALARKVLDSVVDSTGNVIRIYPDKILCDDKTLRCATHDSSHLFYYDDNHLSVHGAELVVRKVESAMKKHRLMQL